MSEVGVRWRWPNWKGGRGLLLVVVVGSSEGVGGFGDGGVLLLSLVSDGVWEGVISMFDRPLERADFSCFSCADEADMAISDMSFERSGSELSTTKAISCVMLFVDWLGFQQADVARQLSSFGKELLMILGMKATSAVEVGRT